MGPFFETHIFNVCFSETHVKVKVDCLVFI
jgi:hypothetical protein